MSQEIASALAQIPHLSASAISDYLACPLLWHGRRIGKWPEPTSGPQTTAMAIGTAIHAAIQAHHQGEDGEVALLTAWKEVRLLEPPKGSFDRALTALELYTGANPAREPFYGDQCETFVRVKVDGVPIPVIGYVDRLDRDNVIHEVKTGRGTYWTQERVDQTIQGTVYWLAYLQQIGEPPAGIVYHVLHTSTTPVQLRELRTQRTNDQVDGFADLCREVYLRMTEDVPVGKCRPGHCRFPDHCRAWAVEHGQELAPEPLVLSLGGAN